MPWHLCVDRETGRKWLVKARNAAEARWKLSERGVNVGRIAGGRVKVSCDRVACKEMGLTPRECRGKEVIEVGE